MSIKIKAGKGNGIKNNTSVFTDILRLKLIKKKSRKCNKWENQIVIPV